MRAHRHEHELVVQIVLPEEHLGLGGVVGETHVAGQSIAGHINIAAVGTLQRHLALSAVFNAELRLHRVVALVGIVEGSVGGSHSRMLCAQVDDAERLAVWDIAGAVGLRLFHVEVVELGIAAVLTRGVEGEECMARTLERDELIRERHLAPHHFKVHTIE